MERRRARSARASIVSSSAMTAAGRKPARSIASNAPPAATRSNSSRSRAAMAGKTGREPSRQPRSCTGASSRRQRAWRTVTVTVLRTVPPSPNRRGDRVSIRRPTRRPSIPPMRPWRGSASTRRPSGSGRRAMRAPASIAAASPFLSPAKTARSSATSAGRPRARARP